MILEQTQYEDSQCPECGQRYSKISSESSIKERIIVPLKSAFVKSQTSKLQVMLTNLKEEVEKLRRSNERKDMIITNLKKDIDYKTTHYRLFQEISKHTEQIQNIKTKIITSSYEKKYRKSEPKQTTKSDIFKLLKREKKNNNIVHSQLIDGSEGYKRNRMWGIDEYHKNNVRKAVQKKIDENFKQIQWIKNFLQAFIKTMSNLAKKMYQDEIILKDWNLKKKVKVCWRYLKYFLVVKYCQ